MRMREIIENIKNEYGKKGKKEIIDSKTNCFYIGPLKEVGGGGGGSVRL